MSSSGALSGATSAGEQSLDRSSRREAMLGWMEEIAPFGIFTTDENLKIRTWNRWMVLHTGLKADAVAGRTLDELFPEVAKRNLDEYFRRALKGQIAVLSTALHKYLLRLPPVSREFGLPHMLQTARIAPLPTKAGIVGTITILEDVTQRECQALILRRQQELDRLLSSTLALLLESERPLQIAAELFPRIAAPLRLEAYLNFLVSADDTRMRLHTSGGIPPETRKAMATLEIGEGPCGQVALHRRPLLLSATDQSSAPHLQMLRRLGLRAYAGFPLMVGDRLLGTLAFGSYERDAIGSDDVDFLARVAQYLSLALDRALRERALQEAQQSLRDHADALESKIAERTVKLHETIEQLESFSYTIAHDLRAPIRALTGYTAVLLNDFSASVPEEGQMMLERLQRASHRLDALTRDLLRFSKIARNDVELSPVDVSEIIGDVLHVTTLRPDEVEIHHPLGIARAQPTLLQQCFSNLFDNAVKFRRDGVALRIRVRSEVITPSSDPSDSNSAHAFHPSIATREKAAAETKSDNDGAQIPSRRLRICIEDNGIGIAPHSHQKIFGIFERVSGREAIEGTGIGLAIVARSMQQMGGSCGVESTLGTGARFWLDLDLL